MPTILKMTTKTISCLNLSGFHVNSEIATESKRTEAAEKTPSVRKSLGRGDRTRTRPRSMWEAVGGQASCQRHRHVHVVGSSLPGARQSWGSRGEGSCSHGYRQELALEADSNSTARKKSQ